MSTADIEKALRVTKGDVKKAVDIFKRAVYPTPPNRMFEQMNLLVESKSLTKSAVGLCYAAEGVPDATLLVKIDGTQVTVGDALRHTTGFGGDFDYGNFVDAADATEFALRALEKAPRVQGFSYNDYMYQILAARFEEFSSNGGLETVLAHILGAKSFDWGKDSTGTPLAPNGLKLSHESAEAMGHAARRLLDDTVPRHLLPTEGWWQGHHRGLRNYVHGWWETADGTLIAIGYRRYYIVALPNDGGVKVQLFDDDYVPGSLSVAQETFAERATRRPLLIVVPHAFSLEDQNIIVALDG